GCPVLVLLFCLDLAMDVATPQQSGILTIWFDPMRQGLPPDSLIHPGHIIHQLPELLELLETPTPSTYGRV
ncbi:MAG TPA: hypothetical protein VFQ36_15960, partial [Ktedonobacteraceae bacterium]|nr:hypothetical protein [Ktedonobacteraceae bacterium]